MTEKDFKNLYMFMFVSLASVSVLFTIHLLFFAIPGVFILLPLWGPMLIVHIILLVDFLNTYDV